MPATRASSARHSIAPSHAKPCVSRWCCLKNAGGVLPLSPKANVLVAGTAADSIGQQSGGLDVNLAGHRQPQRRLSRCHLNSRGHPAGRPAAGGTVTYSPNGDPARPSPMWPLSCLANRPTQKAGATSSRWTSVPRIQQARSILDKLRAADIPTVSVFLTGRPLWVNPELNRSDAFVVAWLPGSEGQGVSDVLFTDAAGNVQHDFTGRLTFSWPATPTQTPLNKGDANKTPLFAYGAGLGVDDKDTLMPSSTRRGMHQRPMRPTACCASSVSAHRHRTRSCWATRPAGTCPRRAPTPNLGAAR